MSKSKKPPTKSTLFFHEVRTVPNCQIVLFTKIAMARAIEVEVKNLRRRLFVTDLIGVTKLRFYDEKMLRHVEALEAAARFLRRKAKR